MFKKRVIIFVISDFLDSGYEKYLAALSKKHEVIPIVIRDPMEEVVDIKPSAVSSLFSKMPVIADIEDMETGEMVTMNITGAFNTDFEKFRAYYHKLFNKMKLDYAEVSSREDYFTTLENLLRRRMRKGR